MFIPVLYYIIIVAFSYFVLVGCFFKQINTLNFIFALTCTIVRLSSIWKKIDRGCYFERHIYKSNIQLKQFISSLQNPHKTIEVLSSLHTVESHDINVKISLLRMLLKHWETAPGINLNTSKTREHWSVYKEQL